MELNVVHGRGPLYWIVRDTGKKGVKPLSGGWMKELGGYWRQGRGIQLRAGKWVVQFGICRRPKATYTEQEGLLRAVEGRMLTTAVKDIGDWK